MKFSEKLDRLDGIMAYDGGCASSGIHDPVFKKAIKSDPDLPALLLALTKQYANDTYGFEQIAQIVEWAKSELDWDA